MGPILIVENIKKMYKTGELALRGVSFSIKKDEFVSIIGPSGAGKSTLLRCINRLVEPTEGRVIYDGLDITKLDYKMLMRTRKRIGMIFQEFNLIERLQVITNVLCGRLGSTPLLRCLMHRFYKSDVEKAIAICERVGLKDHIYKRVDELSGGQRQRVGIARAIIQDPDLLLIDEPISSLDMKIQYEIMDLIYKLSKEENVTAICSIHDVKIATEYSKRILGLQDGSLVFNGYADQLDKKTLNMIYKYE